MVYAREKKVDKDACGWVASLFNGVSIAQRSTRQVRLLVACLVNIEHLTAQCLPNLLWDQFNKTLHITVL